MSAPLDPAAPLALALAAGRARFNALFAAARGAQPALEPGEFAAVLADTVAPAVASVAAADPGRVAAVADALVPLALDLLARRLLGPQTRHPAVAEAWRTLLPALAPRVAAAPAAVAAAVTNAVHALSSLPGGRPGAWVGRMADLGPACPEEGTFRDAGAVVAWQCGLAQLRAAALDAAGRLPADLGARALGLGAVAAGAVAPAIARLRADPWLDPRAAGEPPVAPARELRVVARAGAFRGFGGPFLEPPTVRSSGDTLYAADREGAWRLHADRFGAVFLRLAAPAAALPPGRPATLRVDRDGKVSFAGREARLPECAEPSSYATDGVTAAVTVRGSHAVVLVAPA